MQLNDAALPLPAPALAAEIDREEADDDISALDIGSQKL